MRPLPIECRGFEFDPDEVARGPLPDEETEPEPVGKAVNPLFDEIEEALESVAPDEHPVWDRLDAGAVPCMHQLDLERLAALYQRRRENGLSRFAELSRYPVGDEERVALHNERDHGRPGTLTAKQWVAIRIAWEKRCAYCSCEARRPIIEHVRPICLGGRTELGNIVPSCWHCNQSKGVKEVAPWMGVGHRAFRQRWARAKSRARRWLREHQRRNSPS